MVDSFSSTDEATCQNGCGWFNSCVADNHGLDDHELFIKYNIHTL